jgi:two-component system NtrC family sensor kinase
MKGRRRSAAFELTLAAILILALLLAGFAWLSLVWDRAWLLQEAKRGLTLAADTLHSSLMATMMLKRRDELRDIVEQLGRDTRITEVRILDHKGRIAIATQPSEVGSEVDRTAASCAFCHVDDEASPAPAHLTSDLRTQVNGDMARAFSPILVQPGCQTKACHETASGPLGVIELGVSLADVEQVIHERRLWLSGLCVLTVLIGELLMWRVLARRFRRPMRDLLRGIRRVAQGDLSHRIPTRVRDEFGELAESFNTMSEQVQATQQRLIQSERLISMGKLAAGVAHEINNHLTGILSYAEDLVEDTEPDDPRHEDGKVIVREALRCRKIVRGLLDFARQDQPSRTHVRPRDIMERALDMLVRQAAFQNIRIVRCFDEAVPRIQANELQLEQVLVNLLVNAQQAMPDGGTITLKIERIAQNLVELTVADDGPGIPPEVQRHIFEPFFSTKSGQDGKTAGLGLAVSLGITQQHGGTLTVESEPGWGTMFRLVLPTSRPDGDQPGEGGNTHE